MGIAFPKVAGDNHRYRSANRTIDCKFKEVIEGLRDKFDLETSSFSTEVIPLEFTDTAFKMVYLSYEGVILASAMAERSPKGTYKCDNIHTYEENYKELPRKTLSLVR